MDMALAGTNYMERLATMPPAALSRQATAEAGRLYPAPTSNTPSAWSQTMAARRLHERKALDAQFLAWRSAAPKWSV